jgi:hypothetical protein
MEDQQPEQKHQNNSLNHSWESPKTEKEKGMGVIGEQKEV